MKFLGLFVLCATAITTAAAAVTQVSVEEVSACEDAFDSTTSIYQNPYWVDKIPFDYQRIDVLFHQTVGEAIRKDKANLTKLLIENGADIEVRNEEGLTPFLLSAAYGCTDVLKVLIDAKADKNAQDNNGNTALHLIVEYRKTDTEFYADVVRFLIENNVDTTIQNKDGKTACDLAKETGKVHLIPALGWKSFRSYC